MYITLYVYIHVYSIVCIYTCTYNYGIGKQLFLSHLDETIDWIESISYQQYHRHFCLCQSCTTFSFLSFIQKNLFFGNEAQRYFIFHFVPYCRGRRF